MTPEGIRDDIRSYHRTAAKTREVNGGDNERWGANRDDSRTLEGASQEVAQLSRGCGNPYAVAELEPGESVLDLVAGAGSM